jgi:hypothetical protein
VAAIATDWLGFRAAVVAAVESAMSPSVLETTAVEWADGPRSTARRHVLLSVVSSVFDDRDSALDEGGPQRVETMAVIVVQMSAEATDDAGDADALWLIEQVRPGLRKVSVREALAALGIAIQVFPRSTRNIGGTADGRALSVHAIEATFCCTFVLDTGEDAGLVEQVDIEGTVTDDRGDDIALELNILDPSPEPP